MSRKREREDEDVPLIEIDLSQMPRDVWDLVSRFLSLEDLKNLSQVNKKLVDRMRVLMMSRYRFVVPGTLEDFRALGWTRACQNIRLTQPKSVFELAESDVFVDIEFPFYFNESVEKCAWPHRLTHLEFGWDFKQPVNRLPASLTHLTFGRNFNQPVDRLPASLTHLTFKYFFNQPVDRLPASLTHLTFGWEFNQPVDRLPASLTHLTFGDDFNQSVDHLPASLTYLTFGDDFNQPVGNLPASLTHLTFGWDFNQPVDRLPASLKSVHVKNASQVGLFAPKFQHLIQVVE